MERPQQIFRFAGLALAASLINALSTVAFLNAGPAGLIGSAIGFGIVAALVAWIWRGQSLLGRLALTIWLAFGVGASLAGFGLMLFSDHAVELRKGVHVLGMIAVLLNLGALAYLWSGPATAWLQKEARAS